MRCAIAILLVACADDGTSATTPDATLARGADAALDASATPDSGPVTELHLGCRHFREGPHASARALASPDTGEAGVLADQFRFEITLSGGAGFLGYRPLAPGRKLILLDSDVPLSIVTDDVVLSPQPQPATACAEAVVFYDVVLPATRSRFAFGPSPADRVGLVIHAPPPPDRDPRDPLAEAYCECMLFNCHDPFHAEWGEDDAEAIAGCLAEAAALPRAGEPTTRGDFIECRRHYCLAAEATSEVEAHCPQALGQAVCR